MQKLFTDLGQDDPAESHFRPGLGWTHGQCPVVPLPGVGRSPQQPAAAGSVGRPAPFSTAFIPKRHPRRATALRKRVSSYGEMVADSLPNRSAWVMFPFPARWRARFWWDKIRQRTGSGRTPTKIRILRHRSMDWFYSSCSSLDEAAVNPVDRTRRSRHKYAPLPTTENWTKRHTRLYCTLCSNRLRKTLDHRTKPTSWPSEVIVVVGTSTLQWLILLGLTVVQETQVIHAKLKVGI